MKRRATIHFDSFRLLPHRWEGTGSLSAATPRRGLTLVELLVTIFILVAVLAGVIPVLSPNNEARQIREAARQLNSMIAQAQAQAARDGRPVGIAFRESTAGVDANQNPIGTGIALEAFFIAEGRPFAGFSESSQVRVQFQRGNNRVRYAKFVLAGTPLENRDIRNAREDEYIYPDDPLPPNSIRLGDRFTSKGFEYEIIDDDRDGDTGGDIFSDPPFKQGDYYEDARAKFAVRYVGEPSALAPRPDGWTLPQPYVIKRQPINTSDSPLQFPRGVGIDLTASGFEPAINDNPPSGEPKVPIWPTPAFGFTTLASETRQRELGTANPVPFARPLTVGIMFGPTGRVDGVYLNGERWQGDFNRINLLLGRVESGVAFSDDNGDQIHDELDPAVYSMVDVPLDDDQLAQRREAINWLDPDSRWITINPRSGRLTTSDMSFRFVNTDPIGTYTDPRELTRISPESLEEEIAYQIRSARSATYDARGTGGR